MPTDVENTLVKQLAGRKAKKKSTGRSGVAPIEFFEGGDTRQTGALGQPRNLKRK